MTGIAGVEALLTARYGLRVEPDALVRAVARRGGVDAVLGGDVLAALVGDLVVGETSLFRDAPQLRAVAARLRGRPGPVRLLSAGCSTGEEAYTLAILAREALGPGADVAVRGVDASPAAVAQARRATYGEWALRNTSASRRAAWFEPGADGFVVRAEIRDLVRIERASLLDDAAFAGGPFDVVCCRNVLMYLYPDAAARVADRLVAALAPDGALFLGHAETLRGRADLTCTMGDGAVWFHRRAPPEPAAPPAQPPPRRARRAAPAPPPPPEPLPDVLALVRAERHDDALAALGPADSPRRAAVLAAAGRTALAEEVATRLLAGEPDADVRLVLALCAAARGDLAAAEDHARAAAFLDPTFALPRWHLGVLARRRGAAAMARRLLGEARALLPAERPDRLALFGGGFGADALLAACDPEPAP